MERKTLEFCVGLFVLLGFVALLFVSLQAANLGNFSFNSKTYELNANFDNIGGLKPRAPVKSAGVVVGRVKEINFDQANFQARVVLNIDSQFKFMAPGAKFEQTQSAVVLENLISQFMLQFAEKGPSDK